MVLSLIAVVVLSLAIAWWIKRTRDHRELEQHSITPEALRELMASGSEVLIFDVRLPLDLLADSEIIPGARRVAPHDVLENVSLIPKEIDAIVYCTCPTDKTARSVLHRALAMNLTRVRLLKGGLDGWKSKGYPVEPYTESFHLDTGS